MNLPSKQLFEKHLKDNLHIYFSPDNSLVCRIEEVTSGPKSPHGAANEQFSVIFSSTESQVSEQGVYKITHQQLGEFELFLVPVFGDEDGVQYEAVFT